MRTFSRATTGIPQAPARTMAAVALASLVLAGCAEGGGDALEGNGESGSGGSGRVTIAYQNYTEMQIMAQMYAALLEDAGYTPSLNGVETRDVYAGPLTDGEVDVVPEYVSSMTEFLNRDINGPEAEPVAGPDVKETVARLADLGRQRGITPLEPSPAENANAFAVTERFSQDNDVSALSDLGERDEPVALAAAPDCPERSDCLLGLESVYGIEIQQFEPLGFGTTQTKEALAAGEVDLGQVGTSDGSLEQYGLVVLEDDKNWQNAENLVPVVNTDFLERNPEVRDVLDELSQTLTTEDLMSLNAQVDAERRLAEDVAEEYLRDEGLLG